MLPQTCAQPAAPPGSDVFVDPRGVLRWQKGRQEVTLFGVNYTVPFACSYRAIQRLGVPPEQAIRQDVYHPAWLGIAAFRVHVWDVEISDITGNLLENEHPRLLIAGKVFRSVKRGQPFPAYPQDSVFGGFHVSYHQQLSELNTPGEFYYTATTSTTPCPSWRRGRRAAVSGRVPAAAPALPRLSAPAPPARRGARPAAGRIESTANGVGHGPRQWAVQRRRGGSAPALTDRSLAGAAQDLQAPAAPGPAIRLRPRLRK